VTQSVYDRLGVRRVINGSAWVTVLGGSIMPPEVLKAMVDAAPCYVEMPEFQDAMKGYHVLIDHGRRETYMLEQ